MRRLTLLMLALGLLLSSCSSKQDKAGAAVEQYLKALVAKDGTQLSTLSCADWAPSAQTELDSFQAVDVKLQEASCATTGTQAGMTLVSCKGKLVATYGSENQELDLSVRTYKVVEQGGEWLVCGEQ